MQLILPCRVRHTPHIDSPYRAAVLTVSCESPVVFEYTGIGRIPIHTECRLLPALAPRFGLTFRLILCSKQQGGFQRRARRASCWRRSENRAVLPRRNCSRTSDFASTCEQDPRFQALFYRLLRRSCRIIAFVVIRKGSDHRWKWRGVSEEGPARIRRGHMVMIEYLESGRK